MARSSSGNASRPQPEVRIVVWARPWGAVGGGGLTYAVFLGPFSNPSLSEANTVVFLSPPPALTDG